MSALDTIDGTSSERGPRVHAIRSLLAVVPILALAVLGWLTAAGTTPFLSAGASASRGPAPVADLAPIESRAQPSAPRQAPAEPTETREPATPILVEPAPPSAARLVTGTIERIVDTRDDGSNDDNNDASGPTSTIELPIQGPSVTGLVVSVSLIGSERAGTVTIEGPAGASEVLTVAGPGATTTNGFVVIPGPGPGPARLHNPAGGDIVVDLVGRFEPSGPVSAGRLIDVEPVRLAQLVTATDGREVAFRLGTGTAVAEADPAAALVVITADVGSDGGRITMGPSGAQPTQMAMWGPPNRGSRQRTAVALVTPGDDGRVALRYDGGSVLAVDLIAQVTGEGAQTSSAGLFLPVTAIDTVERTFSSGTTVVGPAVPAASSALVGLRAEGSGPTAGLPPVELATDLTAASGQTIGTILPVQIGTDGRAGVTVTSATNLQATTQLLGYLLVGAS